MTMPTSVPATNDDDFDDDFEFQVPKKSNNTNNQPRRVYFGGLPSQDEKPNLEIELKNWIQEQIPNVNIGSVEISTGKTGKSSFALVDCGNLASLVISRLHQKTWNGKKVTVQREQKKKPTNNNKPQHHDQQRRNQNNNQRGGKKNKKGFNNQRQQQSWGKSWSKPEEEENDFMSASPSFTPIPVEQATEEIGAVVQDELKNAENNGEDAVNVALASTAAASYLAAMDAFDDGNPTTPANENDAVDSHEQGDGDKSSDFDGGFQLQDMSALLADFGEEDKNWMKQEVVAPVEIDENQNKSSDEGPSRLAPHGKAPIHVSFESFGYNYGAPKRPDGWTISQPLAPLDCSSDYEPVPSYLSWMNGKMGPVKRSIDPKLYDYVSGIVVDQVLDCLLQAQDSGYGYAQPLRMTIYLGSDNGRHRSVVGCEKAASTLRSKLRKNVNNQVKQPVSVGTSHRDIDRTATAPKKKKNNNGDSDDDEV